VPPLELVVRGTIMFLFLFALFRFVLRRDAGSIGLADILVVVVVADAAQNGMAGTYTSITDAFVLLGTIAFWNYLFDWLSFHHRWFARFTEPAPVLLIHHGRMLLPNMQRNMITREELQSHLRQNGVTDVSEVRVAALEPDGHISVVKYGGK
jgi:uncharacterized membrane protein YcaP (DUF421 family)